MTATEGLLPMHWLINKENVPCYAEYLQNYKTSPSTKTLTVDINHTNLAVKAKWFTKSVELMLILSGAWFRILQVFMHHAGVEATPLQSYVLSHFNLGLIPRYNDVHSSGFLDFRAWLWWFVHSATRALGRSGPDVRWEGLGHSQSFSFSQRCSGGWRSGQCAGHLSLSTPNLANHVLIDLALRALSC